MLIALKCLKSTGAGLALRIIPIIILKKCTSFIIAGLYLDYINYNRGDLMKNKRVLYIFITLLFVVLVVLMSSVLFSVKETELSLTGNSAVIDNAGIDLVFKKNIGKNIFFIEEDKITTELENNNPYIKVINIERIFPSAIKLHYTERKELFEIKLPDNTYAVLDAGGKVLSKSNTQSQNVLLDFSYQNVEISEFLNDTNTVIVKKLFEAFYSLTENDREYNETLFKNYFAKISIENQNLNIKTRFGAVISITDYNNKVNNKIYYAMDFLDNKLSDVQRANSTLIITEGQVSIID